MMLDQLDSAAKDPEVGPKYELVNMNSEIVNAVT